jgi:methylenetetrahydrofolate reductase (NADPH)
VSLTFLENLTFVLAKSARFYVSRRKIRTFAEKERTLMNIIERIGQSQRTAFSFEILPPLKGAGIDKLYADIDKLRAFDPKYINITTHRSEYVYKDCGNGLWQRNRYRRRPGTVAVAAAVRNKYNIPCVPHILCSGFSREETEYVLLDLQFLGITDLLVLRGDKAPHERAFVAEPDGYAHAIELEEQINRFNRGVFEDGSEMKQTATPFSYGVACYPEKHEEAPNLATDLYWLKRKVETGAAYAVTQLFYDNRKYFDFVAAARAEGITVPIIPGIKPLTKLSQLSVIPKTFTVDIPHTLADEVSRCATAADVRRVGVDWGVAQCRELMAGGVPSLHFYSVGATDSICEIAKQIY